MSVPNNNAGPVLRIIKPTERIVRSSLSIIIYGDPGAGKSSMSFTAGNALVLATDPGFYRSKNRGEALPITTWAEMDSLTNSNRHLIEPYDVLVVDTMGKMIEFCIKSLSNQPPSVFNRNTGQPAPQGWGMVKNRFATWLSEVMAPDANGKTKTVIFVAHARKIKKPGSDEMKMEPDVPGGSLSLVMRECDMMGYLYIAEDGSRVINWSTTAFSEGKDPAAFGIQRVPLIPDEAPDFLEVQIQEAVRRISEISIRNDAVKEIVDKWKLRIDKLKAGDDLDDLLERVQQIVEDVSGLDKFPANQIKKYLLERLPSLGLVYDREAQAFAAAENRPEPEDRPEPKEVGLPLDTAPDQPEPAADSPAKTKAK